MHPAVPPHDALYGGGLLRFWSGNLYGRVMASRESPESRAQVLAIARSIVKERPANGQPPEILSRIPVRLGERLVLRPDRTCFFRSHYVLNAVYYLAPNDVLGLGPAVDASVSEYRPAGTGGTPVRLIQVVYPSADCGRGGAPDLPEAVRASAGGAGRGEACVGRGEGRRRLGWLGGRGPVACDRARRARRAGCEGTRQCRPGGHVLACPKRNVSPSKDMP